MPPAETVVRASTIAGRGLFTEVPLVEGDVVVELGRDVAGVGDLGALNHSCDPALGFDGARTLVARRDVAAGEELTVDYSLAVADPGYVLYCHCGSTRCRQVVEGSDWRIPQLQARYAGRWAPTVQARIDAIVES